MFFIFCKALIIRQIIIFASKIKRPYPLLNVDGGEKTEFWHKTK